MPSPICPTQSTPPVAESRDARGRSFLFDTSWWLFFQELAATVAAGGGNGGGGSTLPRYLALTPGATVTPTLGLIQQDGVLQILLNRATTTIAAATLDGSYPPDGYRFTLMLVNDGTDGRLKVWDAAYLGVTDDDGSGAPDAINTFSFITLPAGAGFVLSTPYSTVEA
jgi:hypothetical protein